jgi:hypothetical protein
MSALSSTISAMAFDSKDWNAADVEMSAETSK